MGAFCTRTICNVEKGDENYNKLLNRKIINMEKKKPEFESVGSRDIPENDEMEVAMTPESPKAAYTHSTPNSSITMSSNIQSSSSPSSMSHTSLDRSSAKHMQIPTPSIQEVQAAMYLFTSTSPKIQNRSPTEKEPTPTLPTMADEVSNLKLANPFASPMVRLDENQDFSAIPGHNTIPSGTSINAGMPQSPTRMHENISTISQSLLGSDIDPNASILDDTDIAKPATPIKSAQAPITPTVANIFGGQDNGTMVIHGDDNESAAQKLTLQMEGSSDRRDDTNVVFSPPNISDTSMISDKKNKVNNVKDSVSKKDNDVQNAHSLRSEKLPSIPRMEIPVEDENNGSDHNDGDDKDKAEDNTVNENDGNTEHINKSDVDIDNVTPNEDKKDEQEPKQFTVNIESFDALEQERGQETVPETRLNPTTSNQSEESEPEKRIYGNQLKMMQMTDPWKSDYETSDLESYDSCKKGENDDQLDQVSISNNKRRKSNEEMDTLDPGHHLRLTYDDTTLNDESSTDDDSPRAGDHSKLYREHSRWKWQKKEINKHEKQMKAQLEKLKADQELADMHNMMQYYRQQSEQTQPEQLQSI